MRPRVFPAEDLQRQTDRAADHEQASMRPRVFPAEDLTAVGVVVTTTSRFNEAAGIPRGRLVLGEHLYLERCASMRPRVFPAEDLEVADIRVIPIEASMRPRVFPAEDVDSRTPFVYN